jgi:hypothetical protein
MFAVIVTGKEVWPEGSGHTRPMTKEGEKFWAVEDHWGPSSLRYLDDGLVPMDVLKFETRAEGEAFAKKWEGHPWWVVPKSHEVVELQEHYVQTLDKYTVKR